MNTKKQSNTEQDKYKIVIVDDHAMIRQGLISLIDDQQDLMVCGQAEDAPEALKTISDVKPDIVILDISLKSSNGLELMKSIKAQYPKLPVLVLSMHNEELYAERALRAGAMGYIMKSEASEEVLTAIFQILSDQIYVSDKISKKLLRKLTLGKIEMTGLPIECLSDRELEVFHLIGQGFGTSQIAEHLHLSVKTIETYRTHIKDKLGLANANELRQYAIQWHSSKEEA